MVITEPKEIDLTPYMESAVARRYEIDGVLSNIHGEHARRTQIMSDVKYDEAIEHSVDEKKKLETRAAKSTRPESIHTFPKDEDGNYLVPLGGNRGYFMGALRVAVKDLYKDKMQNRSWEGYGIGTYLEQGIKISPQWVSVGNKLSHELDEPVAHMVITAGMNRSMIPIYYDVVSKADVHLTIETMNEKIPENILLELAAYVQRLGLGPKGRGVLTITRLVRTK